MKTTKKKFFGLLDKSAQPVPKEAKKGKNPDDYTSKKTHPNKTEGASEKQNGASPEDSA